MKLKIVLLAFVALLPAFQSLHADTLGDKVSVTGSIIQETSTNGTTTVKPITIANVLNVLGISGIANDMRFYFDYTNTSYVIAAKGISTSGTGTGTVVATIYQVNGDEYWTPSKHSDIDAQTASGLNANLTGNALLQGVYPHATETDTTKFLLSGTVSGMNTIMKGSIVDIYKD